AAAQQSDESKQGKAARHGEGEDVAGGAGGNHGVVVCRRSSRPREMTSRREPLMLMSMESDLMTPGVAGRVWRLTRAERWSPGVSGVSVMSNASTVSAVRPISISTKGARAGLRGLKRRASGPHEGGSRASRGDAEEERKPGLAARLSRALSDRSMCR